MVFKAKGAKTFKLRVDHPDGRHAVLTTGCRLETDAEDVEELVHRWQGRKGKRYERVDILDGLLGKRFTLPEAVDAANAGALDRLLEDRPEHRDEIDLAPLVDAWLADKAKARRGAGQVDTYRKQLAVLFPERPLYLSMFTRKHVWAKLDALTVDAPTKNRYRAAASSLAKFLVKRELLETNFVRDIGGYGENDPREVYYEIDDAKKLIVGLAQPYAAIAAAALGFCMEWVAIDTLLVGDVVLTTDPVTARVRGTKRSWRDRVVPLVPELAWILDSLKPALAGKLPSALVFDAVPEWRALDVQRATATALGLTAIGEDDFGQHSLHDWRQTHAVALLRWGYNEQIAADHLGHKDTSLVRTNYGKHRPTKHDYAKTKTAPEESAAVTNPTTTLTQPLKRRSLR